MPSFGSLWALLVNCVRTSKAQQDHEEQSSPKLRLSHYDSPITQQNTVSPTLQPQESVPTTQCQLLLHSLKKPYVKEQGRPVPEVEKQDEVLLQVGTIGLNPIDWKSADYGFGIPSLPCVNGREFVGKVLSKHESSGGDEVRVGDIVMVISTDYRDYRKAAFQEYAIAWVYNTVKIPKHINSTQAAAAGVAFVAAAITLGVSLGISFLDHRAGGPVDLTAIVRAQNRDLVPEDIRKEIYENSSASEQPERGDWIMIMGGSSVTGQMAIQLAKLAGLRVVTIANVQKHGRCLDELGADFVVDRTDLDLALETVRNAVGGSLCYAVDTVGRETAGWCQKVLNAVQNGHNAADSTEEPTRHSHLVGLTGLPKEPSPKVVQHTVPIKLYHTNPLLGKVVSSWLHELLNERLIKPPEIEEVGGGLDSINASLDRLRRGEMSGKRLVVKMGWCRDQRH